MGIFARVVKLNKTAPPGASRMLSAAPSCFVARTVTPCAWAAEANSFFQTAESTSRQLMGDCFNSESESTSAAGQRAGTQADNWTANRKEVVIKASRCSCFHCASAARPRD